MLAIGLAAHRPLATEMEIVIARMSDRPHADRAGEIEHIASRRRLLGDDPWGQPDAMHLADHRVLADADAATDLGGGHPLFPQPRQLLDALRRPGRLRRRRRFYRRRKSVARLQRPGPIHVISPVYCGWSLNPHKIRYHSCGWVPTVINILWLSFGGKLATSVRHHLRKVRKRSSLRGKARPNEPVELLSEVTRIIWLMKGKWEKIEQPVVIGLVPGLQRIDQDQGPARL